MDTLLEIVGLSKVYKRGTETICALRNVSLVLTEGEVVGLLGPNGSGKSTLVRIIAALCDPDGGLINWRGQPLGNIAHELGLLLEGRGAVNDRLSTLENAKYYSALREKKFDFQYFDELVEILEIPDVKCPVRQYSTGLRLRASLLTTLIHRPTLVLLDEPTLGLDALGVNQLERLILKLAGTGASCLVSSHDMHFIERLCPRIVCLHEGSVAFDGPRQLFVKVEHLYRITICAEDLEKNIAELSWLWTCPEDGRFEFLIRNSSELSKFLPDIQPLVHLFDSMEIRLVDLRENYLKLLHSRNESNGRHE